MKKTIILLIILLISIATANALTADIEGNLNADTNTFSVDASNNKVGVGTATPRTPMEIQAAIESDHYGQLIVRDSAALAADIGGQINFGGAYKTDGTKTTWAGIKGGKNNANNDDVSGYLSFWTRHTGSSITERMRIDSLGKIWIGSVQDTNLYRSAANILHTDDNFDIGGTLSKGGGSFTIDHPLDPENKILQHSFVESPDMMTIYKGNSQTVNGFVKITMADWFVALNGDNIDDYSFSITPLNGFCGQYYVDNSGITTGSFIVHSEKDCGFSYVVYGVRHDRWAEANRIAIEVNKYAEGEEDNVEGLTNNEKIVRMPKGEYRHPELYNTMAG